MVKTLHTLRMKIISLTGGIGSGKSEIARILAEKGAAVIDADKVGHAIIQPGRPAWEEIVQTFGRDILAEDQAIDRKKLASKVFSNPDALNKLNQITHPRVNETIKTAIEKARKDGTDVLVVEVQVITGADWVHLTDEVWEVKAPQKARLERLEKRGLPASEALKRMASQMPVDQKTYPKVITIDNSGSLADLRSQLEKLWKALHNKG
jgi:dephospho-CoA kinase